jgi:hypothetical protein
MRGCGGSLGICDSTLGGCGGSLEGCDNLLMVVFYWEKRWIFQFIKRKQLI